MTLTIELDVEDGTQAGAALFLLANAITSRERISGDAIERKTLGSRFYEQVVPDIRSIDIY